MVFKFKRILTEAFKDPNLTRIIDAAKVSARLERIRAEKLRGEKGEWHVEKATGFAKFNEILYRLLGVRLSELPEGTVKEISVKDAKSPQYANADYILIYLGTDEETGQEQLIGMTRGTEVIYATGNESSPLETRPYPKASVNRIDVLPKKRERTYRVMTFGGRRWRKDVIEGEIPSKTKFIKLSSAIFALPVSESQKEMWKSQPELAREPLRTARAAARSGATAFLTNDEIRERNFEKFAELKAARLAPDEISDVVFDAIESLNTYIREQIRTGNTSDLRKFKLMQEKLDKVMNEYYDTLGSYLETKEHVAKSGREAFRMKSRFGNRIVGGEDLPGETEETPSREYSTASYYIKRLKEEKEEILKIARDIQEIPEIASKEIEERGR